MVDLTGGIFGRWYVIKYHDKVRRQSRWLCRCECGTEKIILGNSLVRGTSVSCGCYNRERIVTLGLSRSPEHRVWIGMIHRCSNPKAADYKNYGARGVTVCTRWHESFENFLADMGQRPTARHSIERRDNDKGYSPENCYWASAGEQNRNTRNNRRITINGETKCLIEWVELSGVNYNTAWGRLRRGLSPEQVFSVGASG